MQHDRERVGLAEKLSLKCRECGKETFFPTSSSIGGGAFKVNRQSVMATQTWGRSGLEYFCAMMDLPPPVTKKPYNDHMKKIEKEAVEYAEKVMNEAALRLQQFLHEEEHEMLHEDGNGKLIGDVAVTVDGTWQKRGHSSKIGVVFVIAGDTGEVLDYEIKSLVCYQCRAHKKTENNHAEYDEWVKSHEKDCMINHDGSSESMETEGTISIFKRSIEKRGLQYTIFVGDGDSSCYGKVKEAMSEIYDMQKEECVGHIQKRMGTALRKFVADNKGQKLMDGKPVGGKGRLTKEKIDKIQNYYGMAIRNNPEDLAKMQNDIWAIFHHMIKADHTPLQEQHKYCPKNSNSWCKYWKDHFNDTNDYIEHNRLPQVFQTALRRLFERLTDSSLLSRCLKGLTQNQNESINGMLWRKCPKTQFCGK